MNDEATSVRYPGSNGTDMTAARADLEAAIKLREWTEARASGRRRARSVVAAFGGANLTQRTRRRIDEALRAAGVETTPSIIECDRNDWLTLEAVGERPWSDALPSQIVTWHEFNWTGEGDDGPNGEWLRCLKNTLSSTTVRMVGLEGRGYRDVLRLGASRRRLLRRMGIAVEIAQAS